MGPENQYMPGYGPGGNQMPPGYGQRPQMSRGYGYDQQSRRDMSFQNFAAQTNQQQQPQEILLRCKVIDDPNMIMPIDIPTNGDPACFVMRDFSAIYLRAVNSKGTIDDVAYAPVKRENPEDVQRAKDQEFRDSIFNRFSVIENMIGALFNTLNLAQPKSSGEETQEEPKTKRGGKQ